MTRVLTIPHTDKAKHDIKFHLFVFPLPLVLTIDGHQNLPRVCVDAARLVAHREVISSQKKKKKKKKKTKKSNSKITS